MWSKFRLSDIVAIIEPIDITPCNLIIQKGAYCKIIDIDPDTNDLTLRMCGHYPELRCQANCIAILAADSGKLKRAKPRPYTFKQAMVMTVGGIGVAVILVVTAVAAMPQIVVQTMAEQRALQKAGTSPNSITGLIPMATCPKHQFKMADI